MDARKVICLLALLRGATEGREKELDRLYENALKEEKDVQTLEDYLNGCTFYGVIGGAMRKKGEKLMNMLYSQPSTAMETLRSVRQLNETIGCELYHCRALLCSPEPFSDSIEVLRTAELPAFRQALRTIADICVYLMAVYQGMEPLRELIWMDTGMIEEMIDSVNTRFIPALCQTPQPDCCWVITRKRLGGQALLGGCGFALSYESRSYMEKLCDSGYHKEPMGTHAFLNTRAFQEGELGVPCCWGVGNLVSLSPMEGLQLLGRGIVTRPRSPREEELQSPLPVPTECLRRLTEGGPFCISPEELVSVMDQWEVGHEAKLRKRDRRCLFCGKPLRDGRLVCSTHFTTEVK